MFCFFFVFVCANTHKKTPKKHKNKAIRKSSTKKQIKHKQKINQHINRTQKNINKFMLHLCFVYVLFVFRLYFFYVCQNPKILFSQNKILDFCLTQVLRKQNVFQTQVKHRAHIVSHNFAHLQRRWKH